MPASGAGALGKDGKDGTDSLGTFENAAGASLGFFWVALRVPVGSLVVLSNESSWGLVLRVLGW